MCQAFTHYSLPVKCLWGSSATAERESDRSMVYFYGCLRTVLGVCPDAFDTNTGTVEGPLEDVPGTSRGDRLTTGVEN